MRESGKRERERGKRGREKVRDCLSVTFNVVP